MRGRARVEHSTADRWLISYADFITLLFALFVVLFASAYRDNQSIKRISRAIRHGFDTMDVSSGRIPSGNLHDPHATASIQATTTKAPEALSPNRVGLAELRRQLEIAMGPELRDGEITIRTTPEGFVISLREMGFFNSGEAALLPGAAGKIKRIATILINHGLDVRVEGHSDNRPIHTREFRSNWELSTARAMTVLILIVNESHFDPTRVSVVGYGEYRPVADNGAAEGRRLNRRVDLVVVSPVPSKTGKRSAPFKSPSSGLLNQDSP